MIPIFFSFFFVVVRGGVVWFYVMSCGMTGTEFLLSVGREAVFFYATKCWQVRISLPRNQDWGGVDRGFRVGKQKRTCIVVCSDIPC